MISHSLRCIFVAVPKTGSTSIRKVVGWPKRHHQDLMELKEDIPAYTNPHISLGKRMQILLSPYARRQYVEDTFSSYFKFGFVRNPWDRVVSLYNRKENAEQRKGMSFDEFVHWIQLSSDTCVHPSPHRYQLDWFKDPSGHIVADYIGKFQTGRSFAKSWAFTSRCRMKTATSAISNTTRNITQTKQPALSEKSFEKMWSILTTDLAISRPPDKVQ